MRRPVVLVVIVLAALACSYFLGRVQARQSNVPEMGTVESEAAVDPARRMESASSAASRKPGSSRFSALQTRTDTGDIVAATRLYRDLSLCRRFRDMDWSNTLLANELLTVRPDAMAANQLEGYQAQLDAIESRKRNMQRLQGLCSGADDATIESLVPNMRKAAQLGEPYARACYVALGPNYDARALVRHPEWLQAYRASVPAMIEAGVAAGDRKILDIVREAYQPGAQGLLAGVLGSDPVKYYRYLKLSRLGARPGDVDTLDQQLTVAAARLPRERLDEADEWAETTFRRGFDGRAVDAPGADWDPCVFPYE